MPNVFGRFKQFIDSRHVVQPLHKTIAELAAWYETPLGRVALKEQKQILRDELSCLFGYHLMQLSIVPYQRLSESSRINHCFSLAPAVVAPHKAVNTLCDIQGLAELDALPLADESIDVSILHHVLEFSPNPHQVLKEAARVTVPRGHIIIFAFNPLSLVGAFQMMAQFTSGKPIWRRRPLRAGRIRDWLEFLDFSCLNLRYLSKNLPINHSRYLLHSGFIDRMLSPAIPFGSMYYIVARKDKVGLTPIKPEWDKSKFLGVAPVPKRSMTARNSQSAAILPFRSRIK
ncbi:methyltransferase family protein [Alteromonadaceae bacterium 2753L.S.0a.02]|nr:methyltransferase family protein [Alteromonadaceae bacterium 2753L.S.0a.02]